MSYGLAKEDILQINRVFSLHPPIQEVIIFGSRAIGTYKPGSDIDLAILGDSVTFNDILALHTELEQLGLLTKFDLQRFAAVKDPDLLEHIKRVGKRFYNKAQ